MNAIFKSQSPRMHLFGMGSYGCFSESPESFLIIGRKRSSHGTLQQKKPWQLINCYYRARMKFVTRVSTYRSISRELFTRGLTKVTGVPSLIMSCCTRTVFPSPVLVGTVLIYLRSMKQACTVAVLNNYPRKYWWSLLHHYAKQAFKMASTGEGDVLLIPSSQGWIPHPGIPGNLWVFLAVFKMDITL